ncbi:MAG: hypothetical protein WDO15_21895 [Bacteroidota bacterium]
MGEWLPIDYQYIDVLSPIQEAVEEPMAINEALLEKPYIQTDRDYYYKGETMWLKGYMSYSIPMLKDTMSQSIYVRACRCGWECACDQTLQDGRRNVPWGYCIQR